MLRLILVSVLVALAAGNTIYRPNLDWDSRIVGGTDAINGQIIYQVSLRSAINNHFCGGSILNERWVLSAAHCTINRTIAITQVFVGSVFMNSGGVVYLTNLIINHPEYNETSISNDVSVLRTSTTIGFNAYVGPIDLGTDFIGAGVSSQASGWGLTSHPGGSIPNNLQRVQLSTLSNDDCRSRHTIGNSAFIFESTLCTFTQAGQGICMGDSGGPLTADGRVIGVASWVIPCGNGWPDAWARVSSFRTWILDAMINV